MVNKGTRGVVFALDRGGLVGEDGPTHSGAFDITYLRDIPNLVIMAPKDGSELRSMLEFAFKHSGPVAIRFPRGKINQKPEFNLQPVGVKKSVIKIGKAEILMVSVQCLSTQDS